jgi:hypothetical protein
MLQKLTQIVLVQEVLYEEQRLREGGMVRRAFRSMLDEVLEGEAVLLDSGHRLVKQVFQADRLTLLLTCRGREMIKVMSNSYSWYWLDTDFCCRF